VVTVSERTAASACAKVNAAGYPVQFLANRLSLLGGILGIMLAWLIALIVGAIAAQTTATHPVIEWGAVLLATVFCCR
jgi:hypothetical protein